MSRGTDRRSELVTAAFLLAIVTMLAFRVVAGSREVLEGPESIVAAAPEVANPLAPALSEIELRSTPIPSRDPFRHPVAPRKEPIVSVPIAEKPVEVQPILAALLYDASAPLVQLRIEGMTSGWMGVGGTFQGWTVKSIGPDSAVLEGMGKRLVLR